MAYFHFVAPTNDVLLDCNLFAMSHVHLFSWVELVQEGATYSRDSKHLRFEMAASVDLWDDFLTPPTLDYLTALTDRFAARPLHSRDCTQIWICPSCETKNQPIKNLLMSLPAYDCTLCGVKNPTSYAWSIAGVTFNLVELDFMVYNQGRTKYCSIYAAAGAMECAYRIKGALSGICDCAALDPLELAEVYKWKWGHKYENMPHSMMYQWFDNAPQVLRLVRDHGFVLRAGDIENGAAQRRTIKGFFKVDNDVQYITRLMANGFPLLGCVRVGVLFEFLSAGQIYAAPSPANCIGSHYVVLIGSGTAPREGGTDTFFVARNSHGISAHSVYHKEKYGADFLVWASDVVTVWGFYIE